MSRLKLPVSDEDHIQGPATAPCTLLEYGDYQCPYCGAAYQVVKRLQKDFGDNLRFVFRNFPLTQIHPLAELAAETAEFAGTHGKFWEAHDLIYENQDRLGEDLMFAIVAQLGLPPEDYAEALRQRYHLAHVRRDFSGGVRSGVNGTPGFFLDGELFPHGSNYEALAGAILSSINRGEKL